ncbi:clamp loader subunit [Synechococcus phage S-CBM2]|nr:clamp loader subunit [Synechococcus phage S-CBM2]
MSFDTNYPLKDYLNSINMTKSDLMDGEDPLWEKKYPAWIVNKLLSAHTDTLFLSNEMNMYSFLANKLQFHFFLNSVRKRKRFAPFLKSEKENDLETVKKYYGFSNDKARSALRILTQEQINYMKEKLNTGGKR